MEKHGCGRLQRLATKCDGLQHGDDLRQFTTLYDNPEQPALARSGNKHR